MNLIIMQNHGTSLHQTLKSYSYANAGVTRTKVEKKDDIKCIQIYKLYVLVWLLKTNIELLKMNIWFFKIPQYYDYFV